MKIELLLCPMNLFIMGPIIPADLKQEAEDVSVKIEPTQEIEIEPNNQSDPQVKMEPDIDPLEINQINSVHGELQYNYDKTKYNLKRHIHSVHVDTQCCDQCDYKTGLQRNLKIHIDSVHGGVHYSCDLCDYKAKRKDSLKRHKDSLHGYMQYPCDLCDYKAKRKDSLKTHKDSVHEDVCYTCDLCDYKSTSKNNVIRHIDSVHDYPCNQCGYKATQKGNLIKNRL